MDSPKDWTDKAVSFLMLTNSSGAVAVLSFMGASDKVWEMVGPRIALGCFSLGVICPGIFVAKQFHRFEAVLQATGEMRNIISPIRWSGACLHRTMTIGSGLVLWTTFWATSHSFCSSVDA
jgi:hypothetical protein